ncbi:MAG TPA: cytochrome P450 [Pyrinomonadaceae bacterium]|nr:cytochrome P450 [Pyrinomonadaceae bacterium]
MTPQKRYAPEKEAFAVIVPSDGLPGPSPAPIIGWHREFYRWSRDPIGYLTAMYENFGTMCGWRSERPRVFAFGPSYNKEVLKNPGLFRMTSQEGAQKSIGNVELNCLRSGLLMLDGENHRLHRQLMSPAFGQREIERYWPAIVAIAERMLERWRVGEMRDIEQELRRLVHEVAMRIVLGVEDQKETERIAVLVDRFLTSAPRAMMFPVRLPGTSYSRLLGAAKEIFQLLETLVAERGGRSGLANDVLEILVRTRDKRGVIMTDAQLIGEAYNVLCHESTASALTWAVFLLSQHPEIAASLAEELDGTLRGDPPTLSQLKHLPLLDQIVKETLRILPTAPFARRFAAEQCSLGGKTFPKGTVIFLSQYITQRMPEIFPEPRKFLPARWESFQPSAYEYFPFGIGVHNCIGGTFALTEMKIVLAMLVQRFRLAVPAGARVDRRFELSLRPKNGMRMAIEAQDRGGGRTSVTGDITQMVDLE